MIRNGRISSASRRTSPAPSVVRSDLGGLLRSWLGGLALALTLSACGDGGGNQPESAQAWGAWVVGEAPRREGFDPDYHLGRGLPNMALWQPADFLPPEALEPPRSEICGLPPAQRVKLASMTDDVGNDVSSLAEKLEYARKGYPQAQAGMGWYCLAQRNQFRLEPGQLSPAQALAWAQRGAASGEPRAMYRLADCMLDMARETPAVQAQQRLGPFWLDQAHYWLWRAASDGLEPDAVESLAPVGARAAYSYPTRMENYLHAYKWSRLWQLQAIFRRYPEYSGADLMADKVDMQLHRSRLDEAEMAEGEALVEDWLRQHPDVWRKIAQRPHNPSGSRVLCPGEPGYASSFDVEGLNRELSAYGLQLDPEQLTLH